MFLNTWLNPKPNQLDTLGESNLIPSAFVPFNDLPAPWKDGHWIRGIIPTQPNCYPLWLLAYVYPYIIHTHIDIYIYNIYIHYMHPHDGGFC
jgi:hypothetical protein